MGNSNSKLLPTEQKTSAQQNCTVQQNYTLSGRSFIQTSTTIITAEFLNKIIEENEDIKKLMVQINKYNSQKIAQQDCFERRLLLNMTHIINKDQVSKEYVAGLFRRALTNIVQESEKSPNPIKLIEEKGAMTTKSDSKDKTVEEDSQVIAEGSEKVLACRLNECLPVASSKAPESTTMAVVSSWLPAIDLESSEPGFTKLKQEKAKLESEIQLLRGEYERISKSVSQFKNRLEQELESKITNASPSNTSYEMLHGELKDHQSLRCIGD